MTTKRIILLLLFSTFLFNSCNNKIEPKGDEIDRKIDKLMSGMSLETKVGQMAQITLDVFGKGGDNDSRPAPFIFDTAILHQAFSKYKIGSVLNTVNSSAYSPEWWNKNIKILQQWAIDESGIPLLYGVDAIHGVNYTSGTTLFPQQIGQAATFNPSLVRELNGMMALEMRASNIPWTFSPVQDLGRDPRDPRFWETYGEDVYTCGVMGAAAVKGLQGDGEKIGNKHAAACLKHFLAYNSTSGKDRNPLEISVRELKERHAASFQAAVDAGAKTIMISSGIINGLPTHANHEILTQLLRNEMGFKGLLVTDWADIENFYNRDKITKSQKEAVKIAINAGVDMSMIPYNFKFCDYLIELVNEGEVSMDRIDEAVRRILRVKYELGLFEKPNTLLNEYPEFASVENIALARQAALESITLLKNENNVLPLPKNAKVLVCGPNANTMRAMNGGWSYSWQGEKTPLFTEDYNTFLEAVQNKIGKQNVIYVEGVSYDNEGRYYQEKNININAAVKSASKVDYVLLFLGENSYCEKRGDLHDLYISDNQKDLALALAKTGKPIILILNEGRPRVISKFEYKMKAVIQTYLPSNYGGDALAEILFGDANPQGKLPYTYPMFPNSIINYDYKPSENQEKLEGMYDYESDVAIQYEFGTGLSYTNFKYSNFNISTKELSPEQKLNISVDVSNTGNRSGNEVVMLFSSDLRASITPDNKRLRRFKKIYLNIGETKTVNFTIDASDLAFYNYQNQLVSEKGEFVLRIKNLQDTIILNKDTYFGKPSKLRL